MWKIILALPFVLNAIPWIIVGLVAFYSWIFTNHIIWIFISPAAEGNFLAWGLVTTLLGFGAIPILVDLSEGKD